MSIVTAELEALVMGIAASKAAPAPTRARRLGAIGLIEKAVKEGEEPALLVFASETNLSYTKRAKRMHTMYVEGRLDELRALEMKGSNRYALSLARYRTILVTALERKMA